MLVSNPIGVSSLSVENIKLLAKKSCASGLRIALANVSVYHLTISLGVPLGKIIPHAAYTFAQQHNHASPEHWATVPAFVR